MDPAALLLEWALSGKPLSVGVLLVIAVFVARGLTKLETAGNRLAAAVEKVAADLVKSRENDDAQHARTRERLDEKAREIVAAVATDGTTTRDEFAEVQERRWSAIEDAIERSARVDCSTGEASPPPKRTRTGTGSAVR